MARLGNIYINTPLTETHWYRYPAHASLSRPTSTLAEEHGAPDFLVQSRQLRHRRCARWGMPSLAGWRIWHLLKFQERANLGSSEMGIADWSNCKQTHPLSFAVLETMLHQKKNNMEVCDLPTEMAVVLLWYLKGRARQQCKLGGYSQQLDKWDATTKASYLHIREWMNKLLHFISREAYLIMQNMIVRGPCCSLIQTSTNALAPRQSWIQK